MNPPLSENKNPNETHEQKQLSYSEVIQEANKLLAADESLTPTNNISASVSLSNPITSRLAKPVATVSPLHTSKTNQNRVKNTSNDNQLIDLYSTGINDHHYQMLLNKYIFVMVHYYQAMDIDQEIVHMSDLSLYNLLTNLNHWLDLVMDQMNF